MRATAAGPSESRTKRSCPPGPHWLRRSPPPRQRGALAAPSSTPPPNGTRTIARPAPERRPTRRRRHRHRRPHPRRNGPGRRSPEARTRALVAVAPPGAGQRSRRSQHESPRLSARQHPPRPLSPPTHDHWSGRCGALLRRTPLRTVLAGWPRTRLKQAPGARGWCRVAVLLPVGHGVVPGSVCVGGGGVGCVRRCRSPAG